MKIISIVFASTVLFVVSAEHARSELDSIAQKVVEMIKEKINEDLVEGKIEKEVVEKLKEKSEDKNRNKENGSGDTAEDKNNHQNVKKITQDIETKLQDSLQDDLTAMEDEQKRKHDGFTEQLSETLNGAENKVISLVESYLGTDDELYDSKIEVKKDSAAPWMRRRRGVK